MMQDWMPTLKAYLQALSVTAVWGYDDLPATLVSFPCFVILPIDGSESYGANQGSLGYHNLKLDFYAAGQIIPEAYRPAVEMIGALRNHLARNTSLYRKVADIYPADGRWYEGPGGLNFNFGEQRHLGIRFFVTVKEHEIITVTSQPGG